MKPKRRKTRKAKREASVHEDELLVDSVKTIKKKKMKKRQKKVQKELAEQD